jgi:antitoxin component YwqK of YwqJK toxin-antitoxin module
MPLTIATTAILLMAACKKDSLPDAEGTLLSKIVYRSISDSSTVVTFTYYDNGKLKTTTTAHNNIPFVSTGYLYDASGKLETTEHTDLRSSHVSTYSYIYDGNNIVKKVLHAVGYQFSYQYIYDAQGRLIVDTVFGAGSKSYTDFIYTGDNLTQWRFYYTNAQSAWQSGGNFKATYTNIDNPFYEIGLLCYMTGVDLATGTPGLSKQLLSSIEHPNGLVMHYDYKFYSNGLPRIINVHSPSGINYTGTIEFYYE